MLTLLFGYTEPVNTEVSFGEASVTKNVLYASLPVSYEGASINITDVTYNLTLEANPEEGGMLTGAGLYPPDTEVTFSAQPAEGFAFLNWTTPDGELYSDEAENSLIMTEDVELIANFVSLEFEVELSASPAEGGTVSGDGAYIFGDEVVIEAEPNEGYRFTSWTDAAGDVVSADASYSFTMPSEHVSLTANFDLIDYTVTLQISPLNAGTVTGAGTYNFNESVTITASPNSGYMFLNWTDTAGNPVSDDSSYSFTMPSEDVTYVANFVRVYAVTFNVNMTYVDGVYHEINFNAATDQVFVTGSMFNWADPGSGMASEPMVPTNDDPMIFTTTVYLEPGEYTYKYFVNEGMNHGEWDGDPNRAFFVINSDLTIDDWFGSLTDPTSAAAMAELPTLKVYPNPVRDVLYIESSENLQELRLVDMLGQIVRAMPADGFNTQFNVSDLKSSLYFLQVITSDGMQTHRIQVVK